MARALLALLALCIRLGVIVVRALLALLALCIRLGVIVVRALLALLALCIRLGVIVVRALLALLARTGSGWSSRGDPVGIRYERLPPRCGPSAVRAAVPRGRSVSVHKAGTFF